VQSIELKKLEMSLLAEGVEVPEIPDALEV
jgi:hypothetical protein